jgi:hypothetical protein
VAAARWAQKKLADPNIDPELRVYAIWFNMYPGDSRQRWPAALLTDVRVRHYWDQGRGIGQLYLQLLPAIWQQRSPETRVPEADALWDAYMLYPADAHWAAQPPDVVSWGYPILPTSETLAQELERIAKR